MGLYGRQWNDPRPRPARPPAPKAPPIDVLTALKLKDLLLPAVRKRCFAVPRRPAPAQGPNKVPPQCPPLRRIPSSSPTSLPRRISTQRKDGAPNMILLHYTGMQSGQAALDRLTTAASKVSAHYVVFEDGRIVQCVPEEMRAWHAGESPPGPATPTSIRAPSASRSSIPGHEFGYPDYPLRQIAAVIALCKHDPHPARADQRRPDPRPFRRRADAQAGSGREISLGADQRIRRRPLGAPGAAQSRRHHAAARRPRRGGDADADERSGPTAMASRTTASMTT